jgi:NAD(P) transhydrogenase
MKNFDLIVIGSGPAGEKAAAKAAYFGQSVALVEKEQRFGGAGIQTGTLPSKTLRETALYLSGIYQKGVFGIDKSVGRNVGVHDFMYRKEVVQDTLGRAVEWNLQRHKITVFSGEASFVDDHRVLVKGSLEEIISGQYILIATGSYPYHPASIPFDGVRIHDSDSILTINRFPKSLCVLGAGVIGCEYATIFAAMGVKTFIVNDHDKILGFLDSEVSSALVEQMKKNGITILFNNSITAFEIPDNPEEELRLSLKSGEVLKSDMFLFAAGRSGCSSSLHCERAGVQLGPRETIKVNSKFQTTASHIYAVGDVIGFPALASTSMDQGRIAVAHIFGTGDLESLTEIFPYGIYTIPEVSMVGITEDTAREKQLNYEVGYSYYRDIARGKIMGDHDNGFLKILFEKDNRKIVGVHIMGSIATELIHYGMMLVKEQKTLDEVIATVFNFPTFHDLYKYASYDGLGNLSGKKIKVAGEIIS